MLKGYEEWGVVAIQAPIDANAADAIIPSSTTGIDMSLWSQLECFTILGVTAATLTVDLRDSPTTNGTYTAITGKTQVFTATDDGKVNIIHLDASELNAGARFVRAYNDNNAAAGLECQIILGKANNPPATDNDLSVVMPVVD